MPATNLKFPAITYDFNFTLPFSPGVRGQLLALFSSAATLPLTIKVFEHEAQIYRSEAGTAYNTLTISGNFIGRRTDILDGIVELKVL